MSRLSVHGGPDNARRSTREPPTVIAQIFAPSHHYTLWWIIHLCPVRGSGHFGRAETEQECFGVRRSGCGRTIVIIPSQADDGQVAS